MSFIWEKAGWNCNYIESYIETACEEMSPLQFVKCILRIVLLLFDDIAGGQEVLSNGEPFKTPAKPRAVHSH